MTSADGGDDGDERTSGLASWQKVVGIVGLIVLAVLVILLLTGDHGPGRHASGGGQEQPADVEDAADHDASRWDR